MEFMTCMSNWIIWNGVGGNCLSVLCYQIQSISERGHCCLTFLCRRIIDIVGYFLCENCLSMSHNTLWNHTRTTFVLSTLCAEFSGSVFYLCLSKVSANEIWGYKDKISSHWLRLGPTIDTQNGSRDLKAQRLSSSATPGESLLSVSFCNYDAFPFFCLVISLQRWYTRPLKLSIN